MVRSLKKVFIGIEAKRRIEVWRNGKLVDFHESDIDLVVDAGLDALCGCTSDGSASRPAAFDYIAIGTDNTAPTATQTALGAEVMRVQATYTKDPTTGEASVDATFNITATYALYECGIFNASAGGTMLCRDTYPVKNVVNGDIVKIFYTLKFQRPA
jgi:hypothetical protein